MTSYRVANFAELIEANSSAGDGDEILFTANNYTSTEAITFSKSLAFKLDHGITLATISFGHNFLINGQSGGTTQAWTGPFVFSGTSSTTVGTTLNGPISLQMDYCTFSGSTNSGFACDGDASHAVSCTLNNCSSNDNGDDGFQIYGTTTVTLNECSTSGNSRRSYSCSGSATLTANNCTTSGDDKSSVYLDDSANGFFTDCTFGSKVSTDPLIYINNQLGSSSFTRCTGTNDLGKCIFGDSGVGTHTTSTFRDCTFTNTSSTSKSMVSIQSYVDTYFYDCKFIQSDFDFTGVSENDIILTANNLWMRRCIIDASRSTSNPGTAINMIYAAGDICELEGNVLIGSNLTSGTVNLINLTGGITTSSRCIHNTLVHLDRGTETVNGLVLGCNTEVLGNIFSGFTTGVTTAVSGYYNTASGYNVFCYNSTDISGSTAKSTDQVDVPYDPFYDMVNHDFRIVEGSIAEQLDPSAAYQIDHHQISTVTRGQGSVEITLSPSIDQEDSGPTNAGAYNHSSIHPEVTITATPYIGWVFGRWSGETISSDNPFVFTLTSSYVVTAYFFSDITPHITYPKGGETFNLGRVNVTWNTNNPLALNENPLLSYEIEYTDNYIGEDSTNWHSARRRIPWNTTSYEWITGKMIKSDSVRIRMRSRHHDGSMSDWSMISGNFAINVFKIIPPVIVSPVSYYSYTDFILIILDETLTTNTFNQKVRYTLEYSSNDRNVDWTVIAKDIPVGHNTIRWNLEDVVSADDYVLRLTAKNSATSCEQTAEPTPDQIARRFVYNLKIQQPGMFLIDTKPPEAILDVESSSGITSELTQTLTVFAEDSTSNVEQIQLRECNASQQLALGDVSQATGTTDCESVEDLLSGKNLNFDTIIGKPQGYTAKTQWVFEDVSGLRRLEAMLTDSGGNSSLQALQKTFIPAFRADTDTINDIIVVKEIRDKHNRSVDSNTGVVTITTTPDVDFEVAYIGTQSGKYWVLEPFPRLVDDLNREIHILIEYFDVVYILTYVNNQDTVDTGSIYRDDKTQITNIFDFDQDSLRIPNAVAIFREIMYIGLENGELWSFNGSTPTLITQFANPITSLVGDNLFLYIGQSNSSAFNLYNGTSFFESNLEP